MFGILRFAFENRYNPLFLFIFNTLCFCNSDVRDRDTSEPSNCLHSKSMLQNLHYEVSEATECLKSQFKEQIIPTYMKEFQRRYTDLKKEVHSVLRTMEQKFNNKMDQLEKDINWLRRAHYDDMAGTSDNPVTSQGKRRLTGTLYIARYNNHLNSHFTQVFKANLSTLRVSRFIFHHRLQVTSFTYSLQLQRLYATSDYEFISMSIDSSQVYFTHPAMRLIYLLGINEGLNMVIAKKSLGKKDKLVCYDKKNGYVRDKQLFNFKFIAFTMDISRQIGYFLTNNGLYKQNQCTQIKQLDHSIEDRSLVFDKHSDSLILLNRENMRILNTQTFTSRFKKLIIYPDCSEQVQYLMLFDKLLYLICEPNSYLLVYDMTEGKVTHKVAIPWKRGIFNWTACLVPEEDHSRIHGTG